MKKSIAFALGIGISALAVQGINSIRIYKEDSASLISDGVLTTSEITSETTETSSDTSSVIVPATNESGWDSFASQWLTPAIITNLTMILGGVSVIFKLISSTKSLKILNSKSAEAYYTQMEDVLDKSIPALISSAVSTQLTPIIASVDSISKMQTLMIKAFAISQDSSAESKKAALSLIEDAKVLETNCTQKVTESINIAVKAKDDIISNLKNDLKTIQDKVHTSETTIGTNGNTI